MSEQVGIDLGSDFIPDNIPERDGPIPKGDYFVVISQITKQDTKDKTGAYLKVEMTVIEGTHKGRKVFENINKWNKNAQAVAIADQTLAEIARAVKVKSLRNTIDLCNKPLVIRTDINGDFVRVKKYLPVEAGAATPPSTPSAPSSPTQESANFFGSGGAPWTK